LPKIGQRGGKNKKEKNENKKKNKNLLLARNLSLQYGYDGTIFLTSQYEFLRVFAS